jgi:hypothetical protein
MLKMLKFNPTVPLLFYKATSTYVPGSGTTETWELVTSTALYSEWKGGYGDRAIAAQAVGVKEMAIVRTFYHPEVFTALKTSRVVVAKNADMTVIKSCSPDKNNINCYELWGGVDNVSEANQFMEFQVRRFEGK